MVNKFIILNYIYYAKYLFIFSGALLFENLK